MEDLDDTLRQVILSKAGQFSKMPPPPPPHDGRGTSPTPEREWVNVCVRSGAATPTTTAQRQAAKGFLLSTMSVPGSTPAGTSSALPAGASAVKAAEACIATPPQSPTLPSHLLHGITDTRISRTSEDWVNALLRATWPYVSQHIGNVIRKQLEGTLEGVLGGALRLASLSLGDTAPSVKDVDIRTLADESIRLDTAVDWNADVDVLIDAGFGTSQVGMSAGVDRIKVCGDITIILGPPCPSPPYFNAVQVFFANPPSEVEVGLTGLGMLASSLPGVSGALHKAVSDAVSNVLVLPQKVSITLNHSLPALETARYRCPPPQACFRIKSVSNFGVSRKREEAKEGMGDRCESTSSSNLMWDALKESPKKPIEPFDDCTSEDESTVPYPSYIRVTMGGRVQTYSYNDSTDSAEVGENVFMVFCESQHIEFEALDAAKQTIASTRRGDEDMMVNSNRAASIRHTSLRCGSLRESESVRMYLSPAYNEGELRSIYVNIATVWSGERSAQNTTATTPDEPSNASLLSVELGAMEILPAPPVSLAPLRVRVSAKNMPTNQSGGGTVKWAKADMAARNDMILGVLQRVEELGFNTEVVSTITGLSTALVEAYRNIGNATELSAWLEKAKQEHIELSSTHSPFFNEVLYSLFGTEEDVFKLELVGSDGTVFAEYDSSVAVGHTLGDKVTFTPVDPRVGSTTCSLNVRVVRSQLYC